MAGYYGVSVYNLGMKYQTVFQSGCCIFAFPRAMINCCSASWPEFGTVRILDLCHSNRFMVVACYFEFTLPLWQMLLSIFSYAFVPSGYLLWWVVCSDSFPILKKLVSIIFLFHFKYSLYIWIQVLYKICELQIFSPNLWLVVGMWLLNFFGVILNLWFKAPDLIEREELDHLYLLLAPSISY